jgi:hypothetical protein
MARMPPHRSGAKVRSQHGLSGATPSTRPQNQSPHLVTPPAKHDAAFEQVFDGVLEKIQADIARITDENPSDTKTSISYSESTHGGGLHIAEQDQDGERPAETNLDILIGRMNAAAVQYNSFRFEAARKFAEHVTPLVNEYIHQSDQTTPEGQRALCEFIRGFCSTHGLAIRCPKTGEPTTIFANPRSERKNPLRVVFKHGRRETFSDTFLHETTLIPAPSQSPAIADQLNPTPPVRVPSR